MKETRRYRGKWEEEDKKEKDDGLDRYIGDLRSVRRRDDDEK